MTDTPTPTPTSVGPGHLVPAQVVEVIDGDTIRVVIDGNAFEGCDNRCVLCEHTKITFCSRNNDHINIR